MCLAFSARTIYEFLFSQEEGLPDIHEIDKRSIRDFCAILKQEISKHAERNPFYRYVYLDINSLSLESLFQEHRGRFLDFGSTVMFTADCTPDIAQAIERKYDDDVVTHALRKARSMTRARYGRRT